MRSITCRGGRCNAGVPDRWRSMPHTATVPQCSVADQTAIARAINRRDGASTTGRTEQTAILVGLSAESASFSTVGEESPLVAFPRGLREVDVSPIPARRDGLSIRSRELAHHRINSRTESTRFAGLKEPGHRALPRSRSATRIAVAHRQSWMKGAIHPHCQSTSHWSRLEKNSAVATAKHSRVRVRYEDGARSPSIRRESNNTGGTR